MATVDGLTEGMRGVLADVESGRSGLRLARERLDAALASLAATGDGEVDEGVARTIAQLTAARDQVAAQITTLDAVVRHAERYLSHVGTDGTDTH